MRSQSIGFCQVLTEIELWTKVNANHVFAVPVARDLPGQTVAQSGYEHRDHLRLRIHDQFANTRLRPQKRIRIFVFVARAFGMKADDVAGSEGTRNKDE